MACKRSFLWTLYDGNTQMIMPIEEEDRILKNGYAGIPDLIKNNDLIFDAALLAEIGQACCEALHRRARMWRGRAMEAGWKDSYSLHEHFEETPAQHPAV